MRKNHLILLLFLFVLFLSQAQIKEEENTLEEGTLTQQFDFLIKKGANYDVNGRRYEGIRVLYLDKFNANLTDSLDTNNKTLLELRNTIAEDATEINTLKSKLSETTESLNALTEEKDSMSFFGAMVSKNTYRAMVWSIILVLVFALVLFIYKFRKSNFLTIQAKSALADLEEEYEQHRRRALEREQKISRKLQDEINKNKK